uniref:Pentacotripeptide-repeat region of PRORP domain-containing protein n=1 Tax=Leersia perrieri TaxID=77586 RepID=A0A0D9VRF5_9ORYZ
MPRRRPPLPSLTRRLSSCGDGGELATLLSVLRSPPASSTSLPRALSSAFPSPSDSFPIRKLPHLLLLLPSPLLSLRFLLWRLPPTSPLPSSHVLSSLAASLPDLPSAVPLLLSSSPQPLPLRHYALLLSISAHAGVFPASIALLQHMRSFGIAPDAACFVSALRSAGSPGDVCAVLGIMSASGVSPSVPTVVTAVHKLATAGDFVGARRLIEKMPEFGCVTNVTVYSALLDGMCSFEDVDAALGLVEEMEGGGLGVGCAPNVVSYTCLVKCLCGSRRMVEALGVLDRMVGRGVMPNRVFVRTLVSGFCSEARVADAYAVVERVISDGSVSSEQCYNVLLVCLWRVGMDGEAEGLVQMMTKKGVRLSPLAGSVMIRELCKRNRLLDACYWIGIMEENGVLCDSDVYTGLLLRLCMEGHVDEALVLTRKVAERGILIEASYADRLTELLKRYGDEELASQISGLRRSSEVFSH